MDNYAEGRDAGLRGEQFKGSSAEGYAGYAAGKAERERSQPKAHVEGVGVGVFLLSPLICLVYPVAGVVTVGSVVGSALGIVAVGAPAGVRILVPIGAGLAAFFFGFGLERRAAHSKTYRVVRGCFRLALAVGLPIVMLTGTGRDAAPGGLILIALLMIPIGYWILKRADRVLDAAG